MGSLISAVSSNGEEAGTSEELLEQQSTHKFGATFLNGKEIEVEYTYDRGELDGIRIRINLQALLPVLGGIISPDTRKFVSIFLVEDLLKMNSDLHECSVYGLYSSCLNLDGGFEQEGDKCPHDHFHHYCPEHVHAWFKYYLTTAIILREGDYAEVVKLSNPQDAVYLTTGIRSTPEYWLRRAQRKMCRFSRKTPQELLQRLSTHKFRATFLNGKEIEVEYTYDREGLDRLRIAVNLQGMLPVLGGIISPHSKKFVSVFNVEDLLTTNPNIHECSVHGMYASCSNLDGGLEQEGDKCPYDHLHHYCPEHVNAWFKYYLTIAIILREGDYAAVVKLTNPQDADYLTTEIRSTAEYWLRYAQRKGCRFSRKTPLELLQRLSTHKFPATFLNGKEIEIEYTYVRERLDRMRIAVNLQGLLPILGKIISPDRKKFVSVFNVGDLLKTNRNFQECSVYGIYRSCSNIDGDLEQEGDKCPHDHFHHYCPEHVNAWFKYYLTAAIILREGDYAAVVKLSKPQDADYLTTENRSTAEYWLRYARGKECGFSQKQP